MTKANKYNSIAIMGGTFDPIHNGHLVAAEAVRDELDIDKVIFIPTGNPPHKSSNPQFNNDRFVMTQLATATNINFEVSRMELDRAGKTYAIDTLKELRQIYGDSCKIYYITGADAIADILTWKSPEEVLSLCEFVAVTRPGYDKTALLSTINNLKENYKGKITTLEIPALSISSTDIRNRVFSNKTISYLVPESVEKYILKTGLYSSYIKSSEIDKYSKMLYNALTPKRYKHTQGVAMESYKMAKHYGEDTTKAYIAGLLHDCAKCIPTNQKIDYCKRYGVELDDILIANPDLTHSFLGAKIAEIYYGVKDCDILNAIKYHTTGRANMSLLEKIVYIADYIEPNRAYHSHLPIARELAYKDIDECMIDMLQNTIAYNKDKTVHPLSIEALNYYNK